MAEEPPTRIVSASPGIVYSENTDPARRATGGALAPVRRPIPPATAVKARKVSVMTSSLRVSRRFTTSSAFALEVPGHASRHPPPSTEDGHTQCVARSRGSGSRPDMPGQSGTICTSGTHQTCATPPATRRGKIRRRVSRRRRTSRGPVGDTPMLEGPADSVPRPQDRAKDHEVDEMIPSLDRPDLPPLSRE
jgi:hypothetical protein